MVGGLDNTGFQGEQPSNNANLSGDAWRRPQPTVEQDGTIGAPPSDNSGGNTQWRAGYNGVAPIFQNPPQQQQQQQTPWRAPYNGVAPIYNGGGNPNANGNPNGNPNGNGRSEVYNPNANGNQSTGPVWHAPTNTPGWNAPGPAQNPANPATTAGRPGDGTTGTQRPGANNGTGLYDPHRADIDPFLLHPIGFGGDMVIGGIAGVAFGGPIPYVLNRTAESIVLSAKPGATPNPLISDSGALSKIIPGSLRDQVNGLGTSVADQAKNLVGDQAGLVKGAQWYQNHFDPRFFQNNGLITQANQYRALNDQINSIIERDGKELAQLQSAHPDLSTAPDAVRQRLQVLSDRQDLMTKPEWKTVTDGASEVEKLKTLVIEQGKNANGAALDGAAVGPTVTTQEFRLFEQRQQARAAYAQMEQKQADSAGFWGDSPVSNFIKGAGFVGVTMLADNYLDRLFAGKDHKQGLNDSNMFTGVPLIGKMSSSWHTNALLLPMAFATGSLNSPKGLITKAAFTGAALLGGHVLDAVLPASQSKQVSDLLSPNGVDAVLMGGSWLLPAADLKTRLALIGGAWAIGRVVNLFRGPSQENVKNDGYSEMQSDMKTRSLGSMEDSISSFKKLGVQNDYALRLYASDWLRPGRQYDGALSSYRGAVILCDAWGEARLANGTLVPQTKDQFVNPGQNLDLGGQALRALIIASTNVDRAKQQTQNEMGQQEHGKTVTQGEIDDLTKMGQQINSVIQNKIYGKHDIPASIGNVGQFYRDNTKGWLLLTNDINNSLALNRGGSNTQFVAKLFRDLAVADLGAADFTSQHSDPTTAAMYLYGSDQGRQTAYNNGQPRGYDGAMDAIALAKQFDPTNPDLPALEAYAQQLQQKLPAAIQKQTSNTILNPLQVQIPKS